MKKAEQPLKYILSSISSWVVDTGLFYLFDLLFGARLGHLAEPVCNVAARVFSSFFNFNVNNRLVFKSEEPYGKTLLRYYSLAVPQALASTFLLTLFVNLLHIESPIGSTMVKIVGDGVLFVLSFFIQKFWVFSSNKKSEDTNS